MLMLHVVSVV